MLFRTQSHLKHRFKRIESSMTSLSKTVAQISLELKSMRAVDEMLSALNRDIQHLKTLSGQQSHQPMTSAASRHRQRLFVSNSNLSHGVIALRGTNRVMVAAKTLRSSSEPNLLGDEDVENRTASDENEKHIQHEKGGAWNLDQDAFRVLTYVNPRKLKKLTK